MNLRKGLLRLWLVFALVWIGAVVWQLFTSRPAQQVMGQHEIEMTFDGYEFQSPYGMSEVDVSKMFDSFRSEQLRTSPPNRFAKYKNENADEATALKMRQSKFSAVYRAVEAKTRDELLTDTKSSLAWAGFPFLVLVFGYVIGWIVKGFRA